MNIQDKLIHNYPLVNKVDSELNCYLLDKKRYLVFWEELVKYESIEEVLNYLYNKTKNSNFSEFKTLIVVGKTKENFKKADLLYFDNVNTIVVFYLINEETNEVYMNDSWILFLGLNIVLNNSKYYEIIKKVKKSNFVSMMTLTKGRNAFGIVGKNIEAISSEEKHKGLIEIRCAHEQIRFIDPKFVTKNLDVFNKYKIFTSKGNGGAGLLSEEKQVSILGKSYIALPFTACTDSLIPIGCFDTLEEAKNLQKYMSTKFLRFIVGILKVSQNVYQFVPIQVFTNNSDIDWNKSLSEIDKQLYAKYSLSLEEIDMIESKIKPMY